MRSTEKFNFQLGRKCFFYTIISYNILRTLMISNKILFILERVCFGNKLLGYLKKNAWGNQLNYKNLSMFEGYSKG